MRLTAPFLFVSPPRKRRRFGWSPCEAPLFLWYVQPFLTSDFSLRRPHYLGFGPLLTAFSPSSTDTFSLKSFVTDFSNAGCCRLSRGTRFLDRLLFSPLFFFFFLSHWIMPAVSSLMKSSPRVHFFFFTIESARFPCNRSRRFVIFSRSPTSKLFWVAVGPPVFVVRPGLLVQSDRPSVRFRSFTALEMSWRRAASLVMPGWRARFLTARLFGCLSHCVPFFFKSVVWPFSRRHI